MPKRLPSLAESTKARSKKAVAARLASVAGFAAGMTPAVVTFPPPPPPTAASTLDVSRTYSCVLCGAAAAGIGYNPYPLTPLVAGDACVTCYTSKVLPTIKARRKAGTLNREEAAAARALRRDVKKAEAKVARTAAVLRARAAGTAVGAEAFETLPLGPTEPAAEDALPASAQLMLLATSSVASSALDAAADAAAAEAAADGLLT